jgi:hypothetical protein
MWECFAVHVGRGRRRYRRLQRIVPAAHRATGQAEGLDLISTPASRTSFAEPVLDQLNPDFESGANALADGVRLGDLHRTDHLLLVVLWIVAAVVRADECRVVERTVEDIAEIVTDEGVGRNGRRSAIGGV